MATLDYTLVPSTVLTLNRVKWTPLTQTNNVGAAFGMSDFQDRSVQVFGTFGGATVTIEGSNDDGTTWATLNDPFGNALSFTAAGLKAITELPQYIRPNVSGAGGTTSLTVFVHMRGRDQ